MLSTAVLSLKERDRNRGSISEAMFNFLTHQILDRNSSCLGFHFLYYQRFQQPDGQGKSKVACALFKGQRYVRKDTVPYTLPEKWRQCSLTQDQNTSYHASCFALTLITAVLILLTKVLIFFPDAASPTGLLQSRAGFSSFVLFLTLIRHQLARNTKSLETIQLTNQMNLGCRVLH